MTPNDAPDIGRYRRYIDEALAYAGGTHTFDDVAAAVDAGTMQLWPGVASVVITEIHEFPQQTALNFFLAGGNLAELERMYAEILGWGKLKGCDIAVFTGRKGWERTFLARDGWAPVLTVFERPL